MQKLAQPILILPASNDPQARWLVAVVKTTYESAAGELAAIVSQSVDVASISDTLQDEGGIWEPDTAKESIRRYVTELREHGISIQSIRQTLIRSKPFNEGVLQNSTSQLEIRVLDGNALFGMPSAVVVLSRRDSYESFTTMPPHVLLPRQLALDGRVVTKEEVKLVEHLMQRVENPASYLSAYAYKDYYRYAIIEGATWVKKR